MKYIKTFESYQRYKDFKNPNKWGTPEDLKRDAEIALSKILGDSKIKSIEDQSDDEKGIKFEIKVGNDTIHMFKPNQWRGQWEYYLNKKKTSDKDLTSHFESKMKPEDLFLKYAKSYDYYSGYIDDLRQMRSADAYNDKVIKLFNQLSTSQKKSAIKKLIKENPKSKDNIEKVFKI